MRFYCGLVAILLSTACSRAVPSSETDSHEQGDDHSTRTSLSATDGFYNLLNLSQANYVPLSAEEMARESDVIATGSFVEVTEGMSVDYKSAKVPTALRTIVVALDVTDAIKGTKVGERVYIEFIHGGAVPLETYAARLTQEPVTVFLTPAVWYENEDVAYLNVGSGHPQGTPLYSLLTPQGLLIARDGELLQPTASEQPLQLFNQQLDSLQDISDWYETGASPTTATADAAAP